MHLPMPEKYEAQPTKSFRQAPEEPKYPSVVAALPAAIKDWPMSNPVVLITGALTGIGPATAVAFAKEGAKLVVTGRRRHDDEVRVSSTAPSPASAASISRSTTPAPKANPGP